MPEFEPKIVKRTKDGELKEITGEGKVIPFKKPEKPDDGNDLETFKKNTEKEIKKFIEEKEGKEKTVGNDLNELFRRKSA